MSPKTRDDQANGDVFGTMDNAKSVDVHPSTVDDLISTSECSEVANKLCINL
jgi:hypothetical protein